MKNILNEFKTFALKGSVVDLAVGIIVGAAFNGVVQSLVNDVIMPPIGLFLKKTDFSDLFINLSSGSFSTLAAAKAVGAPTINYGLFINSIISFLVTAFAVFFFIKVINRLRREEEKEPKATSGTRPCPFCFSSISVKASRCSECTSMLKS